MSDVAWVCLIERRCVSHVLVVAVLIRAAIYHILVSTCVWWDSLLQTYHSMDCAWAVIINGSSLLLLCDIVSIALDILLFALSVMMNNTLRISHVLFTNRCTATSALNTTGYRLLQRCNELQHRGWRPTGSK